MAFEILPTVSGAEKKVRASVSFRAAETKKGGGSPRLTVGIPATIAGSFNPKPDQLFAFHIGTDDDAGKGRIIPSNGSGGVSAKIIKGGVTFIFGRAPMLGPDEAEKEYVEVRAIDGGFEIDLPPWLNPYHE